MPRKESKAVAEGNGPIPQQEEFGSGEPTLADVYRMFKERFNRSDSYWYSMRSHLDQKVKKMDEVSDEMGVMSQRVSSLKQDARQPRVAMEVDGQASTKTRERTGCAATAVQAMHGDSFSATRVDPDPMCSTSFGDGCTGPPAPPLFRAECPGRQRRCDAQSCLPSLEMRSPTAAGGLLPTGETPTATKTIFNKSPLRLYSTEKAN